MENQTVNTSTVEGGVSAQPTSQPTQAAPSQPISDTQRVNDIWSSPDPAKSNQSQPEQGQAQNQPQATAAQSGQPATDQKGNQPQRTETDPSKIFAEASPKIFFSDSGDLDSAKVNDYFFNNGKSLLNFAPSTPLDVPPEIPKETVNPETEYHSSLSALSENLSTEISRRRSEGATADEILSEIEEYQAGVRAKYKTSLDLKAAIEGQAKALNSEFEEIRQAKVSAAIERNNTELSSKCEGLINGLDGMQTLTQILLNQECGGPTIDMLFLNDHPEARNMQPDQKNKLVKEWFRGLQQNKPLFAHVAEHGRLLLMFKNFKPILEYAQKVGAARVANAAEAGRLGVGTIQNKAPSYGSSNQNKFFEGFDRVS
jgi:hypothetical protein